MAQLANPAGAALIAAWFFSSVVCAHAASDKCSGGKERLIFSQPSLNEIDGHLFVPSATHALPPFDTFNLISWQLNPFARDGMLTPSEWNAGEKTGLDVKQPVSKHEFGYRDVPGSTTAQVGGEAVGVYLNSRELPQSTHKNKMMITPNIRFSSMTYPFADPRCRLHVSFDLQVPTAADGHITGSETYIVAELLFSDPRSKVLISYGTAVFFNGYPKSKRHTGFDGDTHSYMVTTPLGQDDGWVERDINSASKMSTPWEGWKTFSFVISERDFQAALGSLHMAYRGELMSASPQDYGLAQFHLNAELHFISAPAELGWSMRRARISLD
jgi:hypothetical protein